MKITHLSIIFIIIIIPIMIVFFEYVNTQVAIVKTERIYDERLFDATHDAINAFQLNTINSSMYVPEIRMRFVEASVNIFYTSLVSNFEFNGNLARNMKDYVPAVLFTMYDGYYIYSPFKNTLTWPASTPIEKKQNIDDEYLDGKTINGVKPFVSYTCRYLYNNKEYIITYSMDNYIYVDIFDTISEKHISKGGYLITGIQKINNNTYKYDGVTFSKGDKEVLNEKIGTDTYFYTIENGTKYYYKGNNFNGDYSACGDNDYIFYIDEQREEHKQVNTKINNEDEFKKYYEKIFKNNSAYLYYKEAYEFTTWLLESGKKVDIDGDSNLDEGQKLKELKTQNIVGAKLEDNLIKKDNDKYQFESFEFTNVDKIFENSSTEHLEYSNSNFNRHRAEVIRAVITTNLSAAIKGYKKYSNTHGIEFIMPKISETDWELLENNICVVTFMQGINVKESDKTYNSYCVIPNNYNKEYIDENDICILTKEKTYTKTNDNIVKDGNNIQDKANLGSGTGNAAIGFEPGLPKINFKVREDKDKNAYNPVIFKGNLYLQSYSSLAGSSQINSIEKEDMYRYIKTNASDRLKRVYYTALARERYGSFKYTYSNE